MKKVNWPKECIELKEPTYWVEEYYPMYLRCKVTLSGKSKSKIEKRKENAVTSQYNYLKPELEFWVGLIGSTF